MELLGDWNWYLPRWLEWLPRLTIESTPLPLPAATGGGGSKTGGTEAGGAGASRAPTATDEEVGPETPPGVESGRAA